MFFDIFQIKNVSKMSHTPKVGNTTLGVQAFLCWQLFIRKGSLTIPYL